MSRRPYNRYIRPLNTNLSYYDLAAALDGCVAVHDGFEDDLTDGIGGDATADGALDRKDIALYVGLDGGILEGKVGALDRKSVV